MNWARVFIGSVLAALGTVFVLDYASVVDGSEIVGAWWPLILIGAGVLAYLANPRHWVVPGGLTILGGALLLRSLGVVDTLELVFPLLLIGLGVAIVVGRSQPGIQAGNRINSFNIFSGSEVASHSNEFEGGNIGTVFGGTEIDLRDARPVAGAELDVFVAFGGAEVRVPEGWEVTTKGLPIFGGFENVTATEKLSKDAPHLDINATVLFGGLEVKH